MRLSGPLAALLLAGTSSLTAAAPVEGGSGGPQMKRGFCENTATSRDCWGDYSIDTDVTYTWPNTGVTRFVRTNHPGRGR